jgi:hypothetical protein
MDLSAFRALQPQLEALSKKREDAFYVAATAAGERRLSTQEILECIADSTTLEDLDLLSTAQETLPEDLALFLRLLEDTRAEYARGHRCGVCGLTPAQAKTQDYNCAREC